MKIIKMKLFKNISNKSSDRFFSLFNYLISKYCKYLYFLISNINRAVVG